jgi:hypothetical protein
VRRIGRSDRHGSRASHLSELAFAAQKSCLCEATLRPNPHTGNFLSTLIRDDNEGSMPALVLAKFPGNHESMRPGPVGEWKKQILFRPYSGFCC